jgi:PAS domain S-box-containing protein
MFTVKKVILLILFLLLNVVVIDKGFAEPDGQKTVKVGVSDSKSIFKQQGNCPRELFLELLKDIARRENWKLEFVKIDEKQGFEMLEYGKIDILPAVPFDPSSSNGIKFSKETIISTWAQVYARNSSDIQSFPNLDGLTVGVIENGPYYKRFREKIKQFNLKCTVVEFKSSPKIFEALQKGWINAGVMDRLCALKLEHEFPGERTPIAFSPIQLRFAATDSNFGYNLLTTIDYNIDAMKKDSKSLYHSLLAKMMVQGDEKRILQILKLVSAIGMILILLALAVNILLRYQVKVKTMELVKKNQELQDNMSMRMDAESALRKSHQLLEKTYASIPDGLLLVIGNHADRILNCNRAACLMLGYKENEILMLTPNIIHSSQKEAHEFQLKMTASVHSGFSNEGVELKRKDGTLFPAEMSVTPVNDFNVKERSWVIIIRDITERIKAQEVLLQTEARLRQAQKMEAIGSLSGGIAHDFNNTLTPIIGYAEMAMFKMAKDDPQRKYMNQVLQAANRAKRLVGQILNFSRQSETQASDIKVMPIVKEVFKMLEATLPSTIKTELKIKTDQDIVHADSTQIHQVIMNLCTNSAQAMKKKKGVLEIIIQDSDGKIKGWSEDTCLERGHFLEIMVKDDGHGIKDEVLHRIFDPFFTTKNPGEGTGMGLSVVHGIVKSCGGVISVETEYKKGTVFHIYLPKALKKIKTIPLEETENLIKSDLKNILFVDDEVMIGRMAESMLTLMGCKVTVKADSMEALKVFEKRSSEFDLVITDQTMPGMTGLEMARKMIKIKNDIPIILISGYSDEITDEKLRNLGIKSYLMKPFNQREISEAIEGVSEMKKIPA